MIHVSSRRVYVRSSESRPGEMQNVFVTYENIMNILQNQGVFLITLNMYMNQLVLTIDPLEQVFGKRTQTLTFAESE